MIIGSNVFNLAALLGLAAVVAGWIGFHRRVVVLSGVPAVWVAAVCLLTVAAVVAPVAGLGLAAVVLVPYVAVLGMRRARMERLRLPAGGSGGWWRRSTRRRPNSPRRSGLARAPGVTRSSRSRR